MPIPWKWANFKNYPRLWRSLEVIEPSGFELIDTKFNWKSDFLIFIYIFLQASQLLNRNWGKSGHLPPEAMCLLLYISFFFLMSSAWFIVICIDASRCDDYSFAHFNKLPVNISCAHLALVTIWLFVYLFSKTLTQTSNKQKNVIMKTKAICRLQGTFPLNFIDWFFLSNLS